MELRQRLLLSVALLGAALGQVAHGAAITAPLAQLTQLRSAGAAVSAVVRDLDSGTTLAELQPHDRLTPASLSKIFVAAGALATWPPDKTFHTELRAATLPREGTLHSDVVLRGSGDSTLDEQSLWSLAAQLRGLGVRRITGNVLVERAPFGEMHCDTVDRCASRRRSSRAFNSAPSAIGVNYGSWCLAVRPTRLGQPALLRSCGAVVMPIPIEGQILTVASGGSLRIDRDTNAAGDLLRVSGTIPVGDERQIHRAMSDPALGAGLLLRSILTQLGLVVSGTVETTAGLVANATEQLAFIEGLSLQEQVARMMRYSNNYIADVLTMSIAVEREGPAPRTVVEAGAALGRLWRNPGAATNDTGPQLHSGSGLTTGNRVSAADLIAVLEREYRDTRRFPLFYGALVVPRDAPFAFLREGSADWLDRVALKTGTLSEPVSVCGIAGYLRKKNGGWMSFAIIVNGTQRMPDVPLDRSLRAMRADLEWILAAY